MLVTHAHTPSCTLYCSQVRCVTQLVVWLDSGGDCVLTLPDLLLIDGNPCEITKTSASKLSSLSNPTLVPSPHYSRLQGIASLKMMTCLTSPSPNVLLEYTSCCLAALLIAVDICMHMWVAACSMVIQSVCMRLLQSPPRHQHFSAIDLVCNQMFISSLSRLTRDDYHDCMKSWSVAIVACMSHHNNEEQNIIIGQKVVNFFKKIRVWRCARISTI